MAMLKRKKLREQMRVLQREPNTLKQLPKFLRMEQVRVMFQQV